MSIKIPYGDCLLKIEGNIDSVLLEGTKNLVKQIDKERFVYEYPDTISNYIVSIPCRPYCR